MSLEITFDPEVQAELDGLAPEKRALVERMAVEAACQVAAGQRLGDGQFLKALIELIKVLLPIILEILKTGGI